MNDGWHLHKQGILGLTLHAWQWSLQNERSGRCWTSANHLSFYTLRPRLYVQVLPRLEEPLPSTIALQPLPTGAQLFRLRPTQWTIFQDTTYNIALEQANLILGYFLGKLFAFFICLSQKQLAHSQAPAAYKLHKAV